MKSSLKCLSLLSNITSRDKIKNQFSYLFIEEYYFIDTFEKTSVTSELSILFPPHEIYISVYSDNDNTLEECDFRIKVSKLETLHVILN
jgi:hypothetical protein